MKKFILLIFLLNIFLKISCQDVKLGKTIEQKLEEDDDLNSYEEDHSMDDRMKEQIKEYIQEQNWKPEQELDKETFKKMFVYLIQKGALKQGSTSLLKKLADKILENHAGAILVKNLNQYFNVQELTLTYTRLLNPGKTSDL